MPVNINHVANTAFTSGGALIFKNIGEAVNEMGNCTGEKTLDILFGNVITATTTGATGWTFSNPPASGKSCMLLMILTNGGSAIQTWPVSVDWIGGTPPTLTLSGVDILMFFTVDGGTTWLGLVSGLDFK